MIIELIPKSNKVGEGSINHHLSILNKHFLSISLSISIKRLSMRENNDKLNSENGISDKRK